MTGGASRPSSRGPRKPLIDGGQVFEAICRAEELQRAWAKVWSNAGAAGGDNVTVERFFRDAQARIRRLIRSLRDGSYRPGPVRRVLIPKPSGKGLRPLSIPCIADRVVQTAVAEHLTPLLDEEFEPSSFGYRPGRSVEQAVAQIAAARAEGFGWVVDADIERYFETIPHDRLMERWHQSVSRGPLTELIWTWITHAAPDGRGLGQGSPLSPLLANLYLDRVDEQLHGKGARLVRFADDFVVLCRSEGAAEQAMDRAERLLAEAGLALNREKSRVVDFDRGFRFLGHLFVRSMTMKVAPRRADEREIEAAARALAGSDARAAADAAAEVADEVRKEALGYAPGLRILYVRAPDRRLHIRNQAFAVEEASGLKSEGFAWRELIAIPHQDVDRIELGPDAVATKDAVRHALASDTQIAYVNGHGETLGWTSPALAPRADRHLAQARIALDAGKRLDLARRFVDARLRNQRAVLRRLLGGRKTQPKPVLDALVGLNAIIGRGDASVLRQSDEIAVLTGKEGEATALWWRAISALAKPDFAFPSRQRGEGADAPNICLNFFAWLLARDIAVAVTKAGLHPGFGALHAVSDRRDACVYDLMEEFRAHLIGGLFVYCTNRRFVRPEMFVKGPTAVRMAREGGDALIRAYEARVAGKVKSPRSGKRVTWRRLMVEQAFALAAHAEGRAPYVPYIMDY